MSEEADKESKTEEASDKKTRDPLDKVNVPFSREAPIFASVAGSLVAAAFLMHDAFGRLAQSLQRLIDDPGAWSLDDRAEAAQLVAAVVREAARPLVPILV